MAAIVGTVEGLRCDVSELTFAESDRVLDHGCIVSYGFSHQSSLTFATEDEPSAHSSPYEAHRSSYEDSDEPT